MQKPMPKEKPKPHKKPSEITRPRRGGMQEDVQTPEREEQMSRAVSDALAVTRQAVFSGDRDAALDSWKKANTIIDRHKRERDDPNTVYGKGGRVVGRNVAPKPRRRLEETLVEYYKQRLEEGMVEEGLLKNIGARLGQMDLSPGSVGRALGRTAQRAGNLLRGRGFKTGDEIEYERGEARAEAQRQVTPDSPKSSARPSSVESPQRPARYTHTFSDKEMETRDNIRRRMLNDPRTDEVSAGGGGGY